MLRVTSLLYFTGRFRRRSKSNAVSACSSLPCSILYAFVHFTFLGFLFILKFLWHLERQKRNCFESFRTKQIPSALDKSSSCRTSIFRDACLKAGADHATRGLTTGSETTPGKQDPPPGGGRTVCVESQRRQTHDLLSSYSEIIFHACRFFVFT